jgi:predicted metal-dependent hydrolase
MPKSALSLESRRPESAEGGRVIVLDGVGPVRFVRSRRARRVRLTVRASRGVCVAVPLRASFEEARRFAVSKLPWIRRTLDLIGRARDRCREAVSAAEILDRRTARRYLAERLEALAGEHGFAYRRLSVRTQGTLWGSASAAGCIQLNVLLAVLPRDLSDYVIIHELVHTRRGGHGRAFWRELERHCPDARELRRRLREYTLALF